MVHRHSPQVQGRMHYSALVADSSYHNYPVYSGKCAASQTCNKCTQSILCIPAMVTMYKQLSNTTHQCNGAMSRPLIRSLSVVGQLMQWNGLYSSCYPLLLHTVYQ